MQAERKAKRSLGFDCIENGLRFGHSRTSSVMALDLRRFCRGAATAPINPNRSLDIGEIARLCPQHASRLAEGVAGYVEA